MNIINVNKASQYLPSIIDDVNTNHIPVQILGSNTSGILVSTEDWNAIQETLYLNAFPNVINNIIDGDSENIEDMLNSEELEW